MYSLRTKKSYRESQLMLKNARTLLGNIRAETVPVDSHARECRELKVASLLGIISELESGIKAYELIRDTISWDDE